VNTNNFLGATGSVARPTPLPHSDSCGPRFACWRADCRDRFGSTRTVEHVGAFLLAHCHGHRYRIDQDLAIEWHKHIAEPPPAQSMRAAA
jgi:hypothetical protein